MKILGIIAEYNPFHNGHMYHIEKAKEKIKPDYIIVLMSGSFTEQGNVGIYNKFDRANLALECGADAVIELPTIYAVSSAENFASGAVKILNDMGIITHIAFGSECKNIKILDNVAIKYINFKERIVSETKKIMKSGLSSVSARDMVLKSILTNHEYNEISGSNNILAIEYLMALKTLNSRIQPVLIERVGIDHIDEQTPLNSSFASATSIRALLSKNNINDLKKFVPENTFKLFQTNKALNNEDFYSLLKYEILKLNKSELKNIYEVAEGLENKIYDALKISDTYKELVENIKSKRYSLGRIKRILIYILLGITKEKYKMLQEVSYVRLLKIKEDKTNLLSIISKATNIPLITKINDDLFKELEINISDSLKLDMLATDILSINSNTPGSDYYNEIILKK